MNELIPSIACNLDVDLLSACLPLLEAGDVGGMEWSFDALFKQQYQLPDWFHELLLAYSQEGRLVGHGVFFSLFSGRFSTEQVAWLDRLRILSQSYQFNHITEHFGFMTGSDFHKGAPLSVPFTNTTLAIGIDRISRISDAAACPVGLENLAFAYDLDEVKVQGEFLDALITPVNGFIILDIHNLYCQMHNFEIDAQAILNLYPLDKVREIHISGGSWEAHQDAPQQKVRRDTHDEAVPQEVFNLLQIILPLCSNLKFVVMEQLGFALKTDKQRIQYQQDFQKMKVIVEQFNLQQIWIKEKENFNPPSKLLLSHIPIHNEVLYEQQQFISTVLETSDNAITAMQKLATSSLANSDWQIEKWQPAMLGTAIQIAQKWK